MKSFHRTSVLAILLLLVSHSASRSEDSPWDYSNMGRFGVSEMRAGRAGEFRTYHHTSNDAVEKVVIWYAKRLGLTEDDRLVVAARNGFANLENDRIINAGSGHDTDECKDHTAIVALLSRKHAHITFLHRQSFDGKQDITISITSTADGQTSIVVIEPTTSEAKSR